MSVRDIVCPDCGEREAVHKEGLDEYHCNECGRTFGAKDVTS